MARLHRQVRFISAAIARYIHQRETIRRSHLRSLECNVRGLDNEHTRGCDLPRSSRCSRGLGEETNCPASVTGKFLQRWILRGLRRATEVVCDSRATETDARRLVSRGAASPKIELVRLGLNYPFRIFPEAEVSARLATITNFDQQLPFILHVGSNERRKNRKGVLPDFRANQREMEWASCFCRQCADTGVMGAGGNSRNSQSHHPSTGCVRSIARSALQSRGRSSLSVALRRLRLANH